MKHSILNRLIIGKTLGMIIGVSAFFILPMMGMNPGTRFGIGIIFLLIMIGAVTALTGVMNKHPLLNFRMPFWVRGPIIGMSFYLLFLLLAYEDIQAIMMNHTFFANKSPYMILIDGFIIGLLLDWAETKWAGDGQLPLK